MPSEHKDISQIEAYLTQQMNAEEGKAFEQRLHKEAELHQEVEAYGALLSGFEALQEEALMSNMQGWEGSWIQATESDADLIEWYINDELGEDIRKKVAERIKTDPGFDAKVEEYKTLLGGFNAIQSESLTENMKHWEMAKKDLKVSTEIPKAKVRSLRPIFVRLAAAAAILLLVGVGLQQYMHSQYSNNSLVAGYYQNPGNSNLMGNESDDIDIISSKFEEVHGIMRSQNFEAAIPAFEQFLGDVRAADLDPLTRKYVQENAEWNHVLALIGAKKSDEAVISQIEKIISNPDHEYQQKAVELKKKLNSFWR